MEAGRRAGSREYAELSSAERGAVLNNVAAALMDTSMMRQVVDGDLEKRKALGEELRSLQRRLKQCPPPPRCIALPLASDLASPLPPSSSPLAAVLVAIPSACFSDRSWSTRGI